MDEIGKIEDEVNEAKRFKARNDWTLVNFNL